MTSKPDDRQSFNNLVVTYVGAVLVQLCIDGFHNLHVRGTKSGWPGNVKRWERCATHELTVPTRLFKARSGPGKVFAVARRICSSKPLPRS